MNQYLRNALMGGAAFGLLFGFGLGILSHQLLLGLILGVVVGPFFGIFLYAFTRGRGAEFAADDPSAEGETLLKHGLANHFLRGESVGGYLYLTDRSLIFRSHRFNLQPHELVIPLTEISAARPRMTFLLVPNGLFVRTVEGKERFVVNDRRSWVAAIKQAPLGKASQSRVE